MPKHPVAAAALLALSLVTAPACARATSPTAPSVQPPSVSLLDGSEASFQRWRHVGGGAFVRNPDGSIQTKGGPLGMLWYPALPMRDVVVRLQWRDVASRCCSNSGVFIRFPDPETATAEPTPAFPCQTGPARTRPEWVAIYCGQEIQINQGVRDPQPTGSIYNFKPARRVGTRAGQWNDLTIEITGGGDYTVKVTQNGRLLNTFRNAPGQRSTRNGDPPSDDRQFPIGYLGLQNHDAGDVVQFRDITATVLSPVSGGGTGTSGR